MTTTTAPGRERQRSFLRRQFLPTWEERKRMFVPQAWIIIATSYAAIVFAYVLPQDFRNSAGPYILATHAALMIRTFLFHLGLLVTVLAIIAAAVRKWRLVVAAAPLMAITVGPVLGSYRARALPRISGESVKVMTVNLLYNNQCPAALIGEIAAARPDVLLLQEYSPEWHAALPAALALEYPYRRHAVRDDSFGLAIYSRRPFVGEPTVALSLGDWDMPQARAVIRVNQRDVAFYNIHLLPPRTLEYAAEQRHAFADLIALLQSEQLPILLCGDLNFTNASAFADDLRRLGLNDVQEIAGRGPGATWPVLGLFRALPGIRLDHVFVSKELSSTSCGTGVGKGSDHRPVTAEIGFAPDDHSRRGK